MSHGDRQKSPVYISCMCMVIVALDRYIAITNPLMYETRMTYAVIKIMNEMLLNN